MQTVYKTMGTCAQNIFLEIESGIIKDVAFDRGCNGNGKAVAALVRGMKADEAADKLRGILCASRGTSCGDQLARAIEAHLKMIENQ
ncbi:MAG: TIGR03905 family TSCPD domain-containing protein [Defluviitaleaceae bacterium]|nr:TIGR03905 family TSCPD domain-containing protein [Defluviitaleaceae bacterium]